MADFRTLESEIVEFFRREGIPATNANGEWFLGVSRSYKTSKIIDGHAQSVVAVDADATNKLISLTDLAKYLGDVSA